MGHGKPVRLIKRSWQPIHLVEVPYHPLPCFSYRCIFRQSLEKIFQGLAHLHTGDASQIGNNACICANSEVGCQVIIRIIQNLKT